MHPLAGPWIIGVPWEALRSCPSRYGLVVLLLIAAAVAVLQLPRRVRPVAGAVVFLILGLLFHDRHHLLGDTRLWIDTFELSALDAPLYREPLASRLLGALTYALRPWLSVEVVLRAVSVLCGVLVAWIIGRAARRWDGEGSGVMALAFLLVFLQPLSFLFYGYTETYPLFLAVFALALAVYGAAPGRVPPLPVVGITALATATHYAGALLLVPLASVTLAGDGGRRRLTITWLLLMIAAAVGLAIVPAGSGHSIVARDWTLPVALAYLGDVLNAWFLVALGPVLLWLVLGRPRPTGRFEILLLLSACTYAALPLVADLELGIYRDLDLMGPAFLSASFLVLVLAARRAGESSPPALPSRRLLPAFLPGVVILAGWLTLGSCPAGPRWFGTMLETPALSSSGRSYGYELLADFHRRAGRSTESLAAIRRAVEETPGNTRLRGPLGMALLAAGDTTGAIKSLRQAIHTPRRLDYTPVLAEIHVRRGEAREAIGILEPDHAQGIHNSNWSAALAISYLAIGEAGRSAAVCRARIEKDPGDAIAHVNLAAALVHLRNYSEALEALRRAAVLDPGNTDIQRRLTLLEKELGVR